MDEAPSIKRNLKKNDSDEDMEVMGYDVYFEDKDEIDCRLPLTSVTKYDETIPDSKAKNKADLNTRERSVSFFL